jgi:hypothetical protein
MTPGELVVAAVAGAAFFSALAGVGSTTGFGFAVATVDSGALDAQEANHKVIPTSANAAARCPACRGSGIPNGLQLLIVRCACNLAARIDVREQTIGPRSKSN